MTEESGGSRQRIFGKASFAPLMRPSASVSLLLGGGGHHGNFLVDDGKGRAGAQLVVVLHDGGGVPEVQRHRCYHSHHCIQVCE